MIAILMLWFIGVSKMIEFLQIEKVFINRDINDFSPEDSKRITDAVYCLNGNNKTKVIVTTNNEVLIISLI